MSSMEPHGLILSRWAAALRWADLPPRLQAKALDHVVDTIGVMYAGIDMEACAGARRAAAAWGAGSDSTVVGTAASLPAPTAAFINALHARIHTYDDTYEPGTLHTGSPVVAAALALAEKHHTGGKTFLAAVVAGYEIATRVAASVSPAHYAAGFHNTGTCTVFGAVVAAAHILGLDGDATAEAMGIAGTTAAGLRQHQIDGSMFDSAFHGARGAQSGVMAAQLRAEGVKGPPAILEGPMGFCAVMSSTHDVSLLTRDLGQRYEFEKTTIKAYPTCRFVHGPTEAVLELKRRHRIDPAKIEAVTIATFHQSMEVSDRPRINSPFDAVTSHQYSAALALVKDNVELAEIIAGAQGDARALALMRKVRVVHDAELEKDFPRSWPHRVTIAMNDGNQHTTLSEYPPGRLTPVASDTVDRKFLEQACRYLGDAGARAALAQLRDCAASGDMAGIAASLRPQQ